MEKRFELIGKIKVAIDVINAVAPIEQHQEIDVARFRFEINATGGGAEDAEANHPVFLAQPCDF